MCMLLEDYITIRETFADKMQSGKTPFASTPCVRAAVPDGELAAKRGVAVAESPPGQPRAAVRSKAGVRNAPNARVGSGSPQRRSGAPVGRGPGLGRPGTPLPRNAACGSAGPGRGLRCAAPSRCLPAPAPPRLRSTAPGPAMLRPEPLCLLLLLLLPHGGRATSPAPPLTPGPTNATGATRAAAGNGTQPSPSAGPRRPPGSGLLPGSGLPVLKRAVYVLSALSALAALYFLLRAFRPRSEGPRNERKTHFRLKKPQRKKYGLLSNYDENMEVASLDSDEDTVFEMRNLRR
ncbi:protein FAM174C [Strigops habroptila]|uniref:protein FAM174C n=2 Tax=Psittacidae TaxID=9224 RepID=UPI0011CF3B0E|nr:protein FAM174C [Strigops habroptila]